MIRRLRLFTLFCFLFLIVACGRTSETSSPTEEYDLLVYSGHPARLTNFYVKEFQERTGLRLKVIMGGGSELIGLIDQNAPGDVVIGVGSDSLESRSELLQAYNSPHAEFIRDGYSSTEQKWFGDFLIPMVIIYNNQTVSEDSIPRSWEDLLNPKYNGQIAMGDPTISGSTYTQLATILSIFGKEEEAWGFVGNLIENMEKHVLISSQDVPEKVSRGEFMLGITMESYAYEHVQRAENISFVYPAEGTSARASGVAILANAQHVENAQQFIDFVLDPETEAVVALNFYRRPAHVNIQPPSFMKDFNDITILPYDYEWASKNMHENIQKWLEYFHD